MNGVRGGIRCGNSPSSVVAPIFYALRAARRRCVTARVAAPEHIRMRRRALRAARTVTRGAPSSAIHGSASVAADVVTTPSPPGPMAGRTRTSNILSAAAEGVGAFHAAQTAALKTCPTGFAAFLAVYLEQAPCTEAITSKELLPMPRRFNAPAGRAPRRRHPDAAPDGLPHAPL